MKARVRVVRDKTASLAASVRALVDQAVLVGIPAEKAARGDADGEMTNAQLGFIHEHGSPARNIPARPFLAPGVRAVQEQIIDLFKAAATAALDGNAGKVSSALNRAGIIAQNSVRAIFVDNDWPPLAEATLSRRPPLDGADGKARGKSRRERGALNPLIDTSQLRKSVTYVVRNRGQG